MTRFVKIKCFPESLTCRIASRTKRAESSEFAQKNLYITESKYRSIVGAADQGAVEDNLYTGIGNGQSLQCFPEKINVREMFLQLMKFPNLQEISVDYL